MKAHRHQACRPIEAKFPFKKRGRIPRRWVFLGENDRPFAFLKIPRGTIQKIEDVADLYGWGFEEAVVKLIEIGLKTFSMNTDPPIGALDDALGGITPEGGI
jgi:hypothetical protein